MQYNAVQESSKKPGQLHAWPMAAGQAMHEPQSQLASVQIIHHFYIALHICLSCQCDAPAACLLALE